MATEIKFSGEMQVVPSSKLGTFTQEGWTILDSFDEDVVEPAWGKMPRVYPATNGCYDDGTVSTQQTHVVRTRHFLVGRDVEHPVARLTEQLTKLWAEFAALKQEKERAEETVKAMDRENERTTADLARLRAEREKLAALKDQAEERARKLEADFGKLKTAIGELKVKEILQP